MFIALGVSSIELAPVAAKRELRQHFAPGGALLIYFRRVL